MTKRYQIYKCSLCGNVVEVVEEHGGELVCCGQKMQNLTENTVGASKEKHVPVIEETLNGYIVKVGELEHPMLAEHYIEFVELTVDGNIHKKYLNPGDKPEFEFKVNKGKKVSAREYCNLHGLWKS